MLEIAPGDLGYAVPPRNGYTAQMVLLGERTGTAGTQQTFRTARTLEVVLRALLVSSWNGPLRTARPSESLNRVASWAPHTDWRTLMQSVRQREPGKELTFQGTLQQEQLHQK